MSESKIIITVLLMALSVWITRFLPFIVFKNTAKLPKIIDYLEKALPAAMMGLLVIYCFKDYSFSNISEIVPVIVASLIVVAVHLYKRNTILSISIGTAIYMILVRIL